MLITEAELLIGGPFTRNVSVGKTVADAMTIRSGIRLYLELDNETMTSKQMHEKWLRYEGIDDFILVVCRSKSRMRRLMKGADLVKGAVLFARLDWLRLKKVKQLWVDAKWKRFDIRSLE